MHTIDHETDATLVALVLAGEREAFGPLLLRSYDGVLRLCERLLGSSAEAQDVAQEAALQAFLSLATLHEPARFGAWFHAIAANLARMALRRRRTLSLNVVDDGREQVVLWSAAQPAPDEVAMARETHDAIIAALSELSPVNREVAIGFYLEGYSYAELSTLLGVPISTVKGRLFFGRRQLRRRLQPIADEVWKRSQQQRKVILMSEQELVEVKVNAIIVSRLSGHRIILLQETQGERKLSIWVGPFEADAINNVLNGQHMPRPMTHDLTLHLLKPLGGVVRHVAIHKLVEQTFYAEVLLVQGEHEHCVDARPSDAIALAVRVGAPIQVARSVLDTVGVTNTGTSDAEISSLRIMLVAHKPETRDQLELVLEPHSGMELVALATNVQEAQERVLQTYPDVILLADDPPDIDGIAATEQLLAKNHLVKIILLAPPGSEPDLRRAMHAGARDVLVRPVNAEDLFAVLK